MTEERAKTRGNGNGYLAKPFMFLLALFVSSVTYIFLQLKGDVDEVRRLTDETRKIVDKSTNIISSQENRITELENRSGDIVSILAERIDTVLGRVKAVERKKISEPLPPDFKGWTLVTICHYGPVEGDEGRIIPWPMKLPAHVAAAYLRENKSDCVGPCPCKAN